MSRLLLNEPKSCKTWKAGFALSVLIAISGVAYGLSSFESSHTLSVKAANKMVSTMTHGAAKVTKTFPGPDGLTGAVIEGAQGNLVAWITNQKSAIIIGNVVNNRNQNITDLAAKEYMNQPTSYQKGDTSSPLSAAHSPVAPTGKTLPVNDNTTSVSHNSGSKMSGEKTLQAFVADPHQVVTIQDPNTTGAHTLYAFVDPNCIYCHQFFEMVQDNLKVLNKADVRVVFVPVAILKQSSAPKAAQEVAGGWSALLYDETHFNLNAEEGGLSGKSPSDSAMQAAHLDTEVMNRIATANGFGMETPLIVWKASNQKVYYLNGAPGSVAGLEKILDSFRSDWKPLNK